MSWPAVVETHEGITVVRDDLLNGGSKTRFLDALVPESVQEVVFGGPCHGGAPLALSVIARRRGIQATLFFAKRKALIRRQLRSFENGATINEVPAGYMTNVQRKARDYAAGAGAMFLPLGFDVPAATSVFVKAIQEIRAAHGLDQEEVWCATGSGMLARCLGLAFPESHVFGVAVGLASRWSKQTFPPNVSIQEAPWRFEYALRAPVPFDSCAHYDRKAWVLCRASETTRSRLFWNVLGDD